MKLTTNFNLSEFACKDGTPVPDLFLPNVIELAKNLQVLRDALGKPIYINSAYRTAEHNEKVGGSPKSQHLIAKAADIRTSSLRPKEIADVIEVLIKEGKMKQGGLGVYDNFVHYDCRGKKARW